jgi:hypothetical protein
VEKPRQKSWMKKYAVLGYFQIHCKISGRLQQVFEKNQNQTIVSSRYLKFSKMKEPLVPGI